MEKNRFAGIMVSEINFCNMPVLLKSCGYDFFILDCEHGGFDYSACMGMIMSAKLSGIKAYIRLPDNGRRDITKFMDMGADGLILPMTNTKRDIAEVVRYAKYAPIGKRGISTMRAHTKYSPPKITDYIVSANESTQVFAQIETKEGLANIKEIAACEGLSGLFLGPNDLACDLDLLSDLTAPEILSAIELLADVSKKNGLVSGIITANEKLIDTAKSASLSHYCVGSELSLLKTACADSIAKINA